MQLCVCVCMCAWVAGLSQALPGVAFPTWPWGSQYLLCVALCACLGYVRLASFGQGWVLLKREKKRAEVERERGVS